MKSATRFRRALAAVLVLALLHAAVGTRAWAQVAAVRPAAPLSAGAPQGAISGPSSAAAPLAAPVFSLPAAALTGGMRLAAPRPARAPPRAAARLAPVAASALASASPSALLDRRPALADRTLAAAKDAPAAEEKTAATERTGAPRLESRPRVALVAAKTAAIAAGVKRFFAGKSAETPPAAAVAAAIGAAQSAAHATDLQPAPDGEAPRPQSGGSREPPAPPSAPDDGGDNSWHGLGKVAAFFILASLVAQIGIEALGAAMPALIQKTFGDFTVVAQLAIFSSIAGIIGRQFAPIVIQKHGLRKTFLVGTGIKILSMSILAGLLATGHMTAPLMMLFYSINGLIGGTTITAESSIPKALYGDNQLKMEKFATWDQTLLEILGFLGPIATGAVVTSMGFLPALIAYPVAFVVALLILYFTLRIPQTVERMRLADRARAQAEDKPRKTAGVFKEFFKKIARGYKLVMGDPRLKLSFMAYTAYMILNPLLYAMMAPGYGKLVAGVDGMAGVSGTMTGLYSLGGLLGGLLMILEQKRIEKKKSSGVMNGEQEKEYLRKSMLKWMLLGVAGLAAISTFAFPTPLLGVLSLTIPALALVPFGVAQVITTVKVSSYFKTVMPGNEAANAMGFFGSASLAITTVGLLALKYLFRGTAGFTPFVVIALAMVPLGVYCLVLRSKLAKASAAPAPPAA